jgi:hypothetical protein
LSTNDYKNVNGLTNYGRHSYYSIIEARRFIMVKFNGLLQEITKFSTEAEETLREFLLLPKVKYNTDICEYLCLIDNMIKQISLIVKVHYLDTGEEEMKKDINIVYQYASRLMDMNHKLSKDSEVEKYNVLLNKLKAIMKSQQENLSKLAWELLWVYGPREAMIIVTPGYQVLSGIWIEYRRFILPMEA